MAPLNEIAELAPRLARHRWSRTLLACAAGLLAQSPQQALPAQAIASQDELKAVFLLHLARFVTWPESSFSSPSAGLTIGVFPGDPVGAVLDDLALGERVGSHPVVVRRIRSLIEMESCHLAFFPDESLTARVQLLAHLRGRPVLTVSDASAFLSMGGHVQFFSRAGQLRIRLHRENLRDSGLLPSSQLLRVAVVVEN